MLGCVAFRKTHDIPWGGGLGATSDHLFGKDPRERAHRGILAHANYHVWSCADRIHRLGGLFSPLAEHGHRTSAGDVRQSTLQVIGVQYSSCAEDQACGPSLNCPPWSPSRSPRASHRRTLNLQEQQVSRPQRKRTAFPRSHPALTEDLRIGAGGAFVRNSAV